MANWLLQCVCSLLNCKIPEQPDYEECYANGERVYVYEKNHVHTSPEETVLEYTRRVSAIPEFNLVGIGRVQNRTSTPVWNGYTDDLSSSTAYQVQMLSGSESGVVRQIRAIYLRRYNSE